MTREKKTSSQENKIEAQKTSQNPEKTREAQKTSQNPEKTNKVKNHLLATGLEDYGYWWEQMAKDKSQQSEPKKPFRRGRIWT